MATPFTDPSAFTFITLDGKRTPGRCRRTMGGSRDIDVQEQQAPGFGGAFTSFRYEKISKIDYRFEVTSDAEYRALEAFLASINTGNEKRPPKAYKFLDPYLAHNKIKTVAAYSTGPIEQVEGKQMWFGVVKFTEYKKLKPFGGAVSAKPTNPLEEAVANQRLEVAALRKQLDAAQAASRAGKAK